MVDIISLEKCQVEELIIKSTEGTGHDANTLLTALESKAVLSRFCSLPITVTILVHLFFSLGTDLPTTQTELFRCLILNLLLRNLQTRWQLGVKMLKSFDCLPDFASRCFKSLCQLAHNSVVQNKTAFQQSDIPDLQLPLPLATLGLMRISPHIEWFGVEEELTFIHTTLQEFLAAVHLSTLPSVEQVSVLNQIIGTEHTPVVIFFAGLTRLTNVETFNAISTPCHPQWIFKDFDNKHLNSFFILMMSLYEAQVPNLSRLVQPKVDRNYDANICISLMLSPLTALEMVPLGYFIVHFCSEKNLQMGHS